MQPNEIVTQAIGILAMAANIWSYQQKKKHMVLILQLCGSLLFSINFLLLGAMTGAILNIINVGLLLVFIYKEKTHADHIAWTIGFSLMYMASYIMTFTVFGKDPEVKNFVIELLPVFASFLGIASYKMKDAKAIRKLGLLRSPAWLAYDVLVFTIGGILCEVFSLVSIIIGIIRLDIKKETTKQDK